MFERFRSLKLSSPEAVGGLLIFVGLVLFLVVFIVVFPVLANPVGTYDEWFPEDEGAATTPRPIVAEEEEPAKPNATFRWVAESVAIGEPIGEGSDGEEGAAEEEREEPQEPQMRYELSLEDRSEPGDAEVAAWLWDLGDGTEARGSTVTHEYEEAGVYAVRLTVEDEDGFQNEVEGDIEISEEGISSGRVEPEETLDLSSLESAVEDAVVTLEESVDETLDSVGSAARSAVIVVLFALAAIASTVVAWRVTRSGIMLLRPAEKMRLRVKSADMHVEVGNTAVEEAIADLPRDDEVSADEVDPKLVEV